jgi:ribose transport system permease protein
MDVPTRGVPRELRREVEGKVRGVTDSPDERASRVVDKRSSEAIVHLESAQESSSWFLRRLARQPSGETTTNRLLDVAAPFCIPLATLVLVFVFSLLSPYFLTAGNVQNILRDAALPAMIAVGLTVCLIMNDYDLSVSAASSFSTMLVSILVARESMNLGLGIVLTLVVGIAIGLLNGLLVAYIGLASLVVTIAVASVLNGAEFYVSGNNQVYGGYPEGFVDFARGGVGWLPNIVIVSLVVIVLFWVMLERTVLGRQMRAIGGNVEAARLAGVHVARTRLTGFVLASSVATLAGILYAGRQAVAYPLTGLNVLLSSFAAAFIGAATFKLGEFNIPGTVVGILIAAIASNGLLLLNVPAYASYVVEGGILIAALFFARVIGGRSEA